MTERLYYDDPYCREFDASVVRVESAGDRHAVWLDRSSFYPTTGGQPFDTGSLATARVVDVEDDDEGDVRHVVEGVPLRVGDTVHGVIDWPRRFDHMQQHTGQHLLSAAFSRLFSAKTVSFHLGSDVCTIDLAREVTPAEIARAEDEANRIVWEDRPVSIRYASAEEAAALPLRKEPKRTGLLRLIEVEDFDLSACGGTHVDRTGAVGVIAVSAWERFKGGLRVEFLCGGRVVSMFRNLRDTAGANVRLLSVSAPDVPRAIERLQAETKDQKRLLTTLQTELAKHQALELVGTAEVHPVGRLILRAVEADVNVLRTLATSAVASPGYVAVLVSSTTPALIVVARSADLGLSCHDMVTRLTKQFGGRGGGRPDLAQGGGLNAAPEAVVEAVRAILAAG